MSKNRHWIGWRWSAVFASALVGALGGAEPATSEPYVWKNVAIGGGGFVTGIVAHPTERALMYVRTDVGGAYRWDEPARRWIPLNDWVSATDWNLMGIESLALDPNDPQRLYLAAGTYSRFAATMLRSDDQGRTFQRTDVPIAMGGNETGRFAGERLAVDPNDGRVLFFGSRQNGLWRSGDRGATWERVPSFPAVAERTAPVPGTDPAAKSPAPAWLNQPVGIVAVVFDPKSGRSGEPTPTLYAAVSTAEASLYRSTDAGRTWAVVEGQPLGLRPNHLVRAPDGPLYLTYGRESGPAQITAGAVWKYASETGAWTDISPIAPKDVDQPFGYGCIAVDPRHPATLLVTTYTHWKPHDQIFRSTDGGKNWRPLWQDDTLRWDYSAAPYTASRTPHWLGTVVINPFNSDQALFTTGYGLWASRDLTGADIGAVTHWEFLDSGLEETVPLALISPPAGAHLISGVGDVDGFRHEQLDASPAAGSFSGPRFSSTRDLVFAAQRPGLIARIGNAGRGMVVHVAVSEDGAKTWVPLASDPPGGANGLGRLTWNADGSALLWALSSGAAYVTADRGATWVPCAGVQSVAAVAADALDPSRLYAFDPHAGKFWISTDAGRHFVLSTATFSATPSNARGDVLVTMPGAKGDVWAGSAAGLQHSIDGGNHFTPVTAVEAAEALGFGKAPPDREQPAIFLLGRVRGRRAYYRSDDGGETWVRINDDEHQFGTANRPMVVGDPRVYGRVYLTTGGRGIIYGEPKAAHGTKNATESGKSSP